MGEKTVNGDTWIPVIVAFIAGVASFVPVWYRQRRQTPQVVTQAAQQVAGGAGELVERYEKLIVRLERQIEAQDKKIEALTKRVRVLEDQIKRLGHTPADNGSMV